jgi:predicted transcriptional regulator
VERLLELVAVSPGLSVSEAASRLGVAKSTVSTLSRRLEEQGLIRRVRRGPLVLLYPARGRPSGAEADVEGKPLRRIVIGIVRAAEYPFVVRFSSELRRLGYEVAIRVYGNGLDATFDLVRGRLDLALTPLPTQILFHALTGRLRILGGGVTGGAAVYHVPGGPEHVAYTTKASTMEVCLRLSDAGRRVRRLVYASSGLEIAEAAEKRAAGYVAVWHPYAERVARRARRLAGCDELGIGVCCTLAANTERLPEDLRLKIAKAYHDALTGFWSSRSEVELRAYAEIVSIPLASLRRALSTYRLELAELDPRIALAPLEHAGLRIPHPSSLHEVFEKL